MISAIRNHFKPEVINRIGNNLIVFDFIREEAARQIVCSQMEKINQRVYKQNKIAITPAAGVEDYFCNLASEPAVREMGGRGIGNLMEDKYINPLAEFIFAADCKEGDHIAASMEGDGLKFVKR